jgi:AcrR family transcriptional regulator
MMGIIVAGESGTQLGERRQRAADPRRRMIRSAAVLIRERGVEATSFADVIDHSGAPRGSIYHHFPGGKAQLVEEATRYAGDVIAAGLAAALAEDDPVAAVRGFVAGWTAILRDSDCDAGCPVVAVTVDPRPSPAARDAAGAAFVRWEDQVAGALRERGVRRGRARSLATLAVASIEGAVVLARAQRSTKPLERVGGELEALLGEALAF